MSLGRPSPSVSLFISSWARALALACASLMAARIRSSTTSLSSELKIDGSMSSPLSSPLAVQLALTSPAPDSPSTMMLCISSCSSAIFCCMSWAAFIILAMSPIWPNPLNIPVSLWGGPSCGPACRFDVSRSVISGRAGQQARRDMPLEGFSVFLEGVPFLFDLGQGVCAGLGGHVLFGADVGDLRFWKGGQHCLDQRVPGGFVTQRAVGGIACLGDGVAPALVDHTHPPAGARPALQRGAEALAEVGGRVGGGLELDPAGAVGGEAQMGFDLDQQFHVAVGADQFDHMCEAGVMGERLFGGERERLIAD